MSNMQSDLFAECSKFIIDASNDATYSGLQPVEESWVINRSGAKVPVRFDEITERNRRLCAMAPVLNISQSELVSITSEVASRFRNGMKTRELDAETVSICSLRSTTHLDYDKLAARICVSDLHRRTPSCISELVQSIGNSRYSQLYVNFVKEHATAINARLQVSRDFRFGLFGFQTVMRSYCLRSRPRTKESTLEDDDIVERPQHMYMRIAIAVFGLNNESPDLDQIFTYYDALSTFCVTIASPTILNSGTNHNQMSSCFLMGIGDDLTSIYNTFKQAAQISKFSGGISVWMHGIRAEGSEIKSTNGRTTGTKYPIRLLNDTQQYVDQGGNRPGAFAVYMGVDHADIFTFLRQARVKGEDAIKEVAAADLKYALWVSDRFMRTLEAQIMWETKRVGDETAGDWHLFSPDTAPNLHLVYGSAYDSLYENYVKEGRFIRKVKAREIIEEAFKTLIQVGTPYILFKDLINQNSNMSNVAPICSSNLCGEITLPSWSDADKLTFAQFNPQNGESGETGVCTLAAICLESFVLKDTVNYAGLIAAARLQTRALNNVIDKNWYPNLECSRSSLRHRPIGIGIIGLANVLARLKLQYGSPEACNVCSAIAASIYYGAMLESSLLAKSQGSYSSFKGSWISKGILQQDLWHQNYYLRRGELSRGPDIETITGGVLKESDWAALREQCKLGVRNSYVTAYMPTATTSNMVGQNESFEPFTTNLYTRKTLAGEFYVVNKHLVAELTELGLWDNSMRQYLIRTAGSVQSLEAIPKDVRDRYKTAREMSTKAIVRTAEAMIPYISQSMSLNVYYKSPNLSKCLTHWFDAWRACLPIGSYYSHMKPQSGVAMAVVATKPQAEALNHQAEALNHQAEALNHQAEALKLQAEATKYVDPDPNDDMYTTPAECTMCSS